MCFQLHLKKPLLSRNWMESFLLSTLNQNGLLKSFGIRMAPFLLPQQHQMVHHNFNLFSIKMYNWYLWTDGNSKLFSKVRIRDILRISPGPKMARISLHQGRTAKSISGRQKIKPSSPRTTLSHLSLFFSFLFSLWFLRAKTPGIQRGSVSVASNHQQPLLHNIPRSALSLERMPSCRSSTVLRLCEKGSR